MELASLEPQPHSKDQISVESHASCLPFISTTTVPFPWSSHFLLTIAVHPQHVVKRCIQIQPLVALGTCVGDARPG